MRFPFNPQRRLGGVELVATDADFRVGAGRIVEAPIRDILMLLAERLTPSDFGVAGSAERDRLDRNHTAGSDRKPGMT